MSRDGAIKPGSVVRLKSGGPRMTVESISEGGQCRCSYFYEDTPEIYDIECGIVMLELDLEE